jgi:hypothetical protein
VALFESVENPTPHEDVVEVLEVPAEISRFESTQDGTPTIEGLNGTSDLAIDETDLEVAVNEDNIDDSLGQQGIFPGFVSVNGIADRNGPVDMKSTSGEINIDDDGTNGDSSTIQAIDNEEPHGDAIIDSRGTLDHDEVAEDDILDETLGEQGRYQVLCALISLQSFQSILSYLSLFLKRVLKPQALKTARSQSCMKRLPSLKSFHP